MGIPDQTFAASKASREGTLEPMDLLGHVHGTRVRAPLLLVIVAMAAVACSGGSALPSSGAIATTQPTSVVGSAEPSAAVSAEPSASASLAQPTVGTIDPCSLITQDEADGMVNSKLLDPLPQGEPPVRCVWPTPLEGPTAQVEIDVGDGAKKFLDVEKLLEHQLDPVPGLGDEAVIENDTLFFRKGDLWLAIHVVGDTTTDKLRKPMETEAAIVLTRIGG
jgi:hypothetical protein